MPPRPDADLNRAIGARLRVARTRAGLTRERLAERVNVDATSIYRFESGRRSIGLPMLFTLAEVLGIKAMELVDLETPAHLVPSYATGDQVTELLAAFQRLSPEQQLVAVRLVRALGG